MKFAEDIREAIRIGLVSARANILPMVVLWAMAGSLVVAYYRVSSVSAALDVVARWQIGSGWIAAFLNRVFFLGILPGVFLLAQKSLRPRRVWLVIALQTLWCGTWGVVTDGWYRLLAFLLGEGRDVLTLTLKTLLDQFAFTALLNAPANALFFFWLSQDMSWANCRRHCPPDIVRGIILPNLVTNWCVAFPVVFLLYALPLPLQVQVSGLTSAFWVLVCLQIGAHSARKVEDAR